MAARGADVFTTSRSASSLTERAFMDETPERSTIFSLPVEVTSRVSMPAALIATSLTVPREPRTATSRSPRARMSSVLSTWFLAYPIVAEFAVKLARLTATFASTLLKSVIFPSKLNVSTPSNPFALKLRLRVVTLFTSTVGTLLTKPPLVMPWKLAFRSMVRTSPSEPVI